MNPEERKNLEQGIARSEAHERVESWIKGLQDTAQVVRENPGDQTKIDKLKHAYTMARGVLALDINKRWADNLSLLKEELDNVKKEFGLGQ